MIEAWFDGCTEPINPGGHAAFGVLVKVNGKIVTAYGQYVGNGPQISNNVAEYAGVASALKEVSKYEDETIIRGDSMLVINQLGGSWKVRGGLYQPFYEAALKLLIPIRDRVEFEWIPREENEECDELSKRVLRDRGIRFRIQPETAGIVR